MPFPGFSSPLFDRLQLWDDRVPERDGAWQMAVDEALLAGPGPDPVLRIYRWTEPTLSFGYFLPYEAALKLRHTGEAMVRRWTGGGFVHHAGAFTWTLVVPRSDAFCALRPAMSYAGLHTGLAVALEAAGLGPVTVVPPESPAPGGGLCAGMPAPGDVMKNGRKIAGAGQRRTRSGVLHQGVIFLPETELPASFPDLLAKALAREVQPFLAESLGGIPLARYLDPGWLMKH